MTRDFDAKSTAIVDAAHRILTTEGPMALTVRRIAAEAGMSTMNLYSRFGGKDGVVDELYADGHRRLAARLAEVPETDDPAADLIAIADEYRSFALEHPDYHRLMFRFVIPEFSPSPESVQLAFEALAPVADRIASGFESGRLTSPGEPDAIATAAWLWGSCHGLISLEVDGVGAEVVRWAQVWDDGVRRLVGSLTEPSTSTSG